MTVQEYLDPTRFPRTTQAGLSLKDQMLIDSVNYDDVLEDREAGKAPPPGSEATVKELEAKHAARDEVLAAAKAAGLA